VLSAGGSESPPDTGCVSPLSKPLSPVVSTTTSGRVETSSE
jgi:hypothetical protein